ncbi:MAG TPA: hypothetical protein VMD50_22040 [Mycobacterium sp.]|nr:hypothetical protein [Mycobacterium sp.]HTY34000.1 hypothetical protein [Mycobacterium sp.]
MHQTGDAPVEVEELGEGVLGGVGFGEHAACFGSAAVALVEQDGLRDAGELAEEGRHA